MLIQTLFPSFSLILQLYTLWLTPKSLSLSLSLFLSLTISIPTSQKSKNYAVKAQALSLESWGVGETQRARTKLYIMDEETQIRLKTLTRNCCPCSFDKAPVAQMVKKMPAMWETRIQPLGQEDPLEKGMATHSTEIVMERERKRDLGVSQRA